MNTYDHIKADWAAHSDIPGILWDIHARHDNWWFVQWECADCGAHGTGRLAPSSSDAINEARAAAVDHRFQHNLSGDLIR